MIRTIFFDLGNVLLFFSFDKMLLELEACTKIPKEKLFDLFFQQNLHARFEKGKISGQKLFELIASHAENPSFEEVSHAISNIFTPNYDAWKIVEHLKNKKIELILLSNTNEFHYHFVEKTYPSLIALFDQKVLSFQIGSMKPDKEMFKKAIEMAHHPLNECFYTDDIEENVQSAKELGLDSEVFIGAKELKEQLKRRGINLS